jgi:hypothetical protein
VTTSSTRGIWKANLVQFACLKVYKIS